MELQLDVDVLAEEWVMGGGVGIFVANFIVNI